MFINSRMENIVMFRYIPGKSWYSVIFHHIPAFRVFTTPQTKARPIERKLQEAINCSVYFSSLFLTFDIRLFVQIVFGLMLIG
jgi:hypothetical protein